MALYVGLMSGTSMDAIDAALVSIEATPTLLETHSTPIPAALRATLLQIDASSPLDKVWQLDTQLGDLFAAAAIAVIDKAGRSSDEIRAIGSHGQTVAHDPTGPWPYTVQLGDPNRIAERTGVTTVADFRRRDLAAGGHGAPLAPAFHRAMLQSPDVDRAVVNIGGMANVTFLPSGKPDGVWGFDTGPGNVLLDGWAERHLGTRLDLDAGWAAAGAIDEVLLSALQNDPFFKLAPPKSTGRDYFNLDWVDRHVNPAGTTPLDVQRTLCALTAATIASAVLDHTTTTRELMVCGGGAHNPLIMSDLIQRLPGCKVDTTAVLGIDPDWVEAVAFAWLAEQTLSGEAGNLPAVTGAARPVVLGGIYPGVIGVTPNINV